MGFLNFFSPRPQKKVAGLLYEAVVKGARQPRLYAEFGVPDTVNGRFEMMVLHGFLIMRRLRGEGAEGAEVAQALFDVLFADMDDALRVMGVGDLGVGKRVRKMAEAFYGRAGAYDDALETDDIVALEAAFERNIWPGEDDIERDATALAHYTLNSVRHLKAIGADKLLAGEASFASPEYDADKV